MLLADSHAAARAALACAFQHDDQRGVKPLAKATTLQLQGSALQSVLLLADPLAAADAALANAFQLEEDQRRRQGRSADVERRARQAAEDERLARQLQVRHGRFFCICSEVKCHFSSWHQPALLTFQLSLNNAACDMPALVCRW